MLDLSVKKIADSAFFDKNSNISTMDKLKQKINSLFYRRNKIAHQSDRERENAERQDIDKNFVMEKINDIYKIIEAVCNLVRQK